MKLEQIRHLVDAGPFTATSIWERIEQDLRKGIEAVAWSVTVLEELGWRLEQAFPPGEEAEKIKRPGKLDAMLDLSAERLAPFAVEWETGNIASSHRAMNKMALTLKQGRIAGGVLVLPSRALYRYLTDRMGNYEELEPYFGLYTDLEVDRGYLGVVVVEHDAVSADVPKIRKGTDGRALVYKRVTPAQDAPDRDHEPSLWPRRQGSWLRPAPLRLSTGG